MKLAVNLFVILIFMVIFGGLGGFITRFFIRKTAGKDNEYSQFYPVFVAGGVILGLYIGMHLTYTSYLL